MMDGRRALDTSVARPSARTRVAGYLEPFIFYALLVVVALTAVPYGTVEPWWKAAFQCAVFALGFLGVIEVKLSGRGLIKQHRLLLPLLALVAFAFVQAYLPLRSAFPGSDLAAGLRPISFAPYDTRMAALQLLALIVAAGLLIQYTTNRRRLMGLICIVVGVGLVSTIFGFARVAFQTESGFLLPHLQPNDGSVSRGVGFAQFINYNHFAFLAEMSLGLVLGLTLRRPLRIARFAAGVAIAIVMWIAVVYSGSRGGLVSVLGQVLFVALMVFVAGPLLAGRENRLKSTDTRRERAGQIGSLLVTRIILIASFLVFMVIGMVWVGGDPLATRLETVSEEFGPKDSDKYSNTMRSKIWPASWQLVKDHPLAGVGMGAYWIAITTSHHASGDFTPQQAHNDYLEMLASGGLVGVAFCVWFLVLFLREVITHSQGSEGSLPAHAVGALAGIFAVALHSITDFGLHVTVNSILFVVLLVISIARVPTLDQQRASEAA